MTRLLRLGQRLAPLARAYAGVLFCESPWVGAWFAAITWWSPHAALAGLVALLAAAFWGQLLGLSGGREPHLLNSMLVGLFVGAFHTTDLTLLGWLLAVALVTTLISHWLAALLWRWGKLPVLSLPFVLITWMVMLAMRATPVAPPPLVLTSSTQSVFTPWLDNFFMSLGGLMLVPYPVAGALLFAGLTLASRYLALLAVAGYLAGHTVLWLLHHQDGHAADFNFMLSAMALGGIFMLPGRSSFLLALAGGALAAWLTIIQGALLHLVYLPLLTLPFIFAVYLWLGGMSMRTTIKPPYLSLDYPTLPETSIERLRLARTRGGDPTTPALQPPFHGEWRVSQGFNGPHTHRGAWCHALDFHITEGTSSHRGSGFAQGDYYCFGAPVLAPTSGQVVRLRDDLPDLTPGEVDVVNNWGNFLLLRSTYGYYVVLAHLSQGSLRVQVGQWVETGQAVATCGSSGRSPEPHLHLHVQNDEWLGSPTRPFHLTNVLVRNQGHTEFHLYHLPAQGTRLAAAPRNAQLTAALHLLPGRVLTYRLRIPGITVTQSSQLRSELTLLGQARLVADGGSSAAFIETPAVIGYFDRRGKRHALLDLWLLALGLTPLSTAAEHWGDRPGLHLLPLGPIRRLFIALLRPLGAGCDSRYHRYWDEASHTWRQEGRHCVRLAPGIEWCGVTIAWIEPNRGIKNLQFTMFGKCWEAVLETCGWLNA
ncbi:MAG: urea transporter [Gammaproteobacteria bacterium]|nr:urea transporter [Gammaproteobacteria bacterium]